MSKHDSQSCGDLLACVVEMGGHDCQSCGDLIACVVEMGGGMTGNLVVTY